MTIITERKNKERERERKSKRTERGQGNERIVAIAGSPSWEPESFREFPLEK